MRVAMIGKGYVGLVSGACLADFGHHVTCVDKDAAKIAALRRRDIPIYEPDLDRIVETNARLNRFTVIVTKSIVPVGTGDEVERIVQEARPDADFAVVSNPEFLREGAAIRDFKHPDRIVIGADDPRARHVIAELYRPLCLNQAPILYTSRRAAELSLFAMGHTRARKARTQSSS
jgi:UDPglucose 6-dehydrogenase